MSEHAALIPFVLPEWSAIPIFFGIARVPFEPLREIGR